MSIRVAEREREREGGRGGGLFTPGREPGVNGSLTDVPRPEPCLCPSLRHVCKSASVCVYVCGGRELTQSIVVLSVHIFF